MNIDATHPVRVILFYNSKHARGAFGHYFTGAAKNTWTFTRMVTHVQLVRKIFKHQGMDPNQWHVQMTMRVPNISREDILILVEFELVQSQAILDVQHTHVLVHMDHSNVRQRDTAITQMVSDEPSMLYPDIQEDDEDDDDNYADYNISSASDDDNGDNDNEDDIGTPLNPLSSTVMNQ
ncbi:hypothetical protein M9H77_23908 [Catharanthus roseus]|uniref:Uncharacterized protein n=1 Tax=Catharanthus roseus TaxID=4058 RepID=A0ACC0AUM9_CATRO|nr:hypothetical protein M9H77_23908 [Catharanthus roseus]